MGDAGQRPVRILVVDDVERNLVALDALLASPTVEVVRARSGEEALRALERHDFALIVLDVRMPVMDGFETAAAIRQAEGPRPVPIIFMTAHGSTQAQLAKAYALGASDFIEKPIDPEAIRAKVRVITDLSRMVQDVRRDAQAKQEQALREERERWETERLRARVVEQERATAAEHVARVEAENANKLKDEFLATLSHELRTPLSAIAGWVGLIKARGAVEPSFSRGMEAIDRNTRAQVKLIDDMLDTSRILAGKLRLEVTTVDLVSLIDRSVEAMRPAAERKRLSVTGKVDRDLPPALGDPDRLQQILGNVLSNAVKFTPEGGEVSLVAERDDSFARLTIRDTGKGISADFLPQMFDRFRQEHGGTSRPHSGLGIGLALARDLVELHGGTIEARSDGPGRGATFVIRLPLGAAVAGNAEANRAAAPPAQTSLTGARVLVVDDETDARELLREVAQTAGATVLAVDSADAALAALPSWRPSVVLSDIGMAGKDGYALMRAIRALPPEAGGNVPAIAVTAYTSADDAARARAAGFQTHLAKPVEPNLLLATIASAVHRSLD
ncbi:MAG TPA: response regulator [Polyangia bacterium]|jgi:signal transduction histidine kinase|nr:response regulator [Polyangia bacterium]